MLISKYKIKKIVPLNPINENKLGQLIVVDSFKADEDVSFLSNRFRFNYSDARQIEGATSSLKLGWYLADSQVAFLNYSGGATPNFAISSIQPIGILSDQEIELHASTDIILAPESLLVYPSTVGDVDLGNATYYFDEVNHKVLTDRGCPLPDTSSALAKICKMNTKKRWLTEQDAINEGMGKRALKRIRDAGGQGEFEERDLSTFPPEIIAAVRAEERELSRELYNEKRKEYEDWKADPRDNIPQPKEPIWIEPHDGVVLNELIWFLVKATQELANKVDKLEKSHG